MDLGFRLKQCGKMVLQHAVLPAVYAVGCVFHPETERETVLFADAHHTRVPFSMERMLEAVGESGMHAECRFHDYTHEGTLRSALHSISFMWRYSAVGTVVLCDNFLPVSSCRKRKGTKVVQLWHSCGLMKKMGYDTEEDIPRGYRGNVYRNYDLVTVSAPACIPWMESGMRQPKGVVRAIGVSRTDVYFDPQFRRSCEEEFHRAFPDAEGKKVVLWAPTFRGRASDPKLCGEEAVARMKEALGDDWYVIVSAHPHLDAARRAKGLAPYSDSSVPSDRLLWCADVLITDYSTIFSDYLLTDRPFVMFAPDLDAYENGRGFAIDYRNITPYFTTDGDRLTEVVRSAYENRNRAEDTELRSKLRKLQVCACDGAATARILAFIRGESAD